VRVGERWLTWAEKAEEDLKLEVREAVAAFAASTATTGAAAAGEKARARVAELAATSPALVLEELKARRAELSKEFFEAPEQEKLKKLRERLLELQRTQGRALPHLRRGEILLSPHAGERETEYRAVQLEVDRLVTVVRAKLGARGGGAAAAIRDPRAVVRGGRPRAAREPADAARRRLQTPTRPSRR
jgi:hypothetical protein